MIDFAMPEFSPSDTPTESFISHLLELRNRIIRAGLGIGLVFLSLIYWAPTVFRYCAQPLLKALPEGGKMIVTDITGSFFVPMKLTMMVAFVIALPWVLYQAWLFIAPGLYRHEKRLTLMVVTSSYALFLLGMAFAYFLVFPTIFHLMANYSLPLGVQMATDIASYLSFVTTILLVFGIAFELPVLVTILVHFGVCQIQQLKQARPYVIVGAFVIAAVVTPPDIFSQCLLAIPLCLLYEVGLFAARFSGNYAAAKAASTKTLDS